MVKSIHGSIDHILLPCKFEVKQPIQQASLRLQTIPPSKKWTDSRTKNRSCKSNAIRAIHCLYLHLFQIKHIPLEDLG
ncbi:hypothetical protein SORBI_3007G090439 [Sorghum bicolor]|uniref:Uncharacterized protein n=1 Tax=Sorghum bicolor TaxID=4558 RepID=A0A1Z5R8T5_SORBI|nr:hypothetical protein SORBI_3007G090439 [Sorghum bicolor]